MTATATALDVRPLSDNDEPAVIDLLNASLGGGPAGRYTPDFFGWKHRANPFGESPGLVAVHDGRIVGVRLFLRWALEAAGEPVQAVRAVDTATDPAFQGQGIFKRLTLGLLDQLDGSGQADLVFNTPNTQSRPGYLKMGWRPVGTLAVRLCPTRPVQFLRGVRSAAGSTASSAGGPSDSTGVEVLRECEFGSAAAFLGDRGDEVAALLSATARTDRLHTPVTLEYLRWRYAEAPGLDYRCVAIESKAGLIGLAFGRMRRRGALTEFTVADTAVRGGDRRAARQLLVALRRAGADHVAIHTSVGTETHAVAATAGYFVVPRNGVGLVANPRRETPVSPLELASWRLSLGDLEVF